MPPSPAIRLRLLGIQTLIALLLSAFITVVNYGLEPGFLLNWLKGFVSAMIVIPIALRAMPLIAGFWRRVLGQRPDWLIRITMAITVACLIEGVVSLAITLVQHGPQAGMLTMWGHSFIKALPIGLLIGFTMAFVVMPRIQRLLAQQGASPAVPR
ncbi:MAG: DUF2798 domain-containing protein [Pigmentiphaga sp.]|uniref:DUF2798 domain-containing protein n=1 Tax=Pigmentiphaga sp. TaxID=1977564 RepID=UPI0029AD714F|nr:DUF2798 domain-containing protein [Pigmentiphaga sp.]MDX3904235.1 DUF2798 domain-containing protein [Pigmentiphaga sp.]